MLTVSPLRRPFEPAQLGIRRSLLRRHVRSVVAGKTERLHIDLSDKKFDPAPIVIEFADRLARDGAPYARLLAAVRHPGVANRVIDNLGSRDPVLQARSARVAGAFQMEEAVPWIAPLLWSREPAVRVAAARSLARIRGIRSANALVAAIQRLGPRPVLIIALARAAPDLYLESILSLKQPRGVQSAVAIAAGLRGRRTAVAPLIAQMGVESARNRAASCRALGWIRSTDGIPVLVEALEHRDWRVRMSASKALGGISSFRAGSQLLACLVDRNPNVRAAAQNTLRRRGRQPLAALGEERS